MPRKAKPANRYPGVYALPTGGFRYMVRVAGKQQWYSLNAAGERFASREEAHNARLAHLVRLQNPTPEWSKDSIGAYLEQWHAGRPNLSPNTRLTNRAILNTRILPQLGALPLIELTPAHVRAWHAELAAAKYAPSSIHAAHTLLSAALADAVEWDLLPRNVASRVTPPQPERDTATVWMPEQVRAFLVAIEGHRHEAAFRLLLATGLRLGELLALRWPDVDYQERQVTIARTLTRDEHARVIVGTRTKSPAGRRVVPLTDTALVHLRRHQDKQAFVRRIAGDAWHDDDLVFTTRRGERIHPDTLRRQFRRVLETAKLGELRIHDLRHTAATLLLVQGTPVHIVSRILGHASPSITLTMYAHYLPAYGREAVDELERLFGSG